MKKIALTSLLAVFAVSGAHAANVIDGNPLYMPGQNHFYSVSTLGSHSEDTVYTAGEEFGYGIMDNWAINLTTSMSEDNAFDNIGWNELRLGTTFRALDMDGWKLDLVGAYEVDPVWGDHSPFLEEDDTDYTWTAGVRGGYVGSNWTVAAKALFNYSNFESFNWNEDKGKQGEHTLVLGLDGQYVFDSNWSVLGTVEYTGRLDKKDHGVGPKLKNEGEWFGELGVNYNIDATKFVGAYINGSLNHHGGDNADEWEFDDGFGYGVKFGIDF